MTRQIRMLIWQTRQTGSAALKKILSINNYIRFDSLLARHATPLSLSLSLSLSCICVTLFVKLTNELNTKQIRSDMLPTKFNDFI